MRRQHERFNGYFSVTTSRARGQTPGFLHVGSAHVPCRPAPYRESTRKPRGRSRRPPIRSRLTRLRRTHTRDSTATFPLLQVEHEAKHPVFACGLGSCTLQTRPIPREHQKTAWEEQETSDTSGLTRLRRTHTRDSTATFPLLQVEHEAKHPVFACGLGSCTLQTRPIPREHQKTAWEEQETSDTSRLTRLRRTHTRDSTATFPLLQVEHESKHPVFACGLGSCTLQTRPIPREHQKTAWDSEPRPLHSHRSVRCGTLAG